MEVPGDTCTIVQLPSWYGSILTVTGTHRRVGGPMTNRSREPIGHYAFAGIDTQTIASAARAISSDAWDRSCA